MSKARRMKKSTQNDDSKTEVHVCVTCSTRGECENVFILTFEDTCFSKIFNSCMGFELSEDTEMKYICLDCINTIISFHTFKGTALKSYEDLRRKDEQIEICISKVIENNTENSDHIVLISIVDANMVESSEAESSNVNELEPDVKVKEELTEKIKQEYSDTPSNKPSDKPDVIVKDEVATPKEQEKDNMWQCYYCNVTISHNDPAGIKKHQYAEKVKRITIFECPICHKKYTKTRINEHVLRHSQEKPAKCKICGKGVSSFQILKQHMMLHDGKKFTCNICNKGFTQQFLLKEHLRGHEKDKTFLCPTCGMSFPNPTRLRQHLYKHNKQTISPETGKVVRHICDVCGKSFACARTLEVHSTKHVSEDSFECARCGKKYGHKSLLTSHIWTHIAEFRCQTCFKIYQKDDLKRHDCIPIPEGEVFDNFLPNECRKCGEILQHGNLDRHLKRHDARECKICGAMFFTSKRYQFHVNTHKLKCELCGKGFAKKDSYILHTRNQVCVKIRMNKIKRFS